MFAVFATTFEGATTHMENVQDLTTFQIREQMGVYRYDPIGVRYVFALPCAAFVEYDGTVLGTD